jgi:phage terminase large subunit-like protein
LGVVKPLSANGRAFEDEMREFGLGGLSNNRSPDRVYGQVWALTALVLDGADRAAGQEDVKGAAGDAA